MSKRFLSTIGLSTLVVALAAVGFAQEKLVFDFESGDLAREGWSIVQGENSKPIGSRDAEFHDESVPYQKNGKYYLTTLESTADAAPTDDTLCVIESPVFTILGNKISFLIGGGGNRENVRVELALVDDQGAAEPVRVAKGKDSQKLDPVDWDVAEYKNRRALIRVIDLEKGGWAHIRCDNFQIDGALAPEGTATRRAYFEKLEAERIAKEKALREEALAELPEAILYVRRTQYRPDHHNTATIFQKGEINEGSFVGDSALVVWFKDSDETKTLLELPDGVVRDPCLSFDAKKVLFSFRKSRDDDYHVGEMTLDFDRPTIVLKAETSVEEIAKLDGFKQLTFVKGASDIDPIYLPTGEIVFSSTREPKYCMCNRHIMCNLHKMNGDGTNIEQIGKSTLFEGHSALLSDGRIIYDRWEYVDRNFGDAQGVWVANPDGTKHEIFWGNNTASPGGVIDARPTPDDDSVFLCTLGSCHDRPWGAIALIDRRLGIDGRAPVVKTWPPEVADWVSDAPAADPFLEAYKYDTFRNTPRKYEDPFPLDDEYVLASGQIAVGSEEMGIYVLAPEGGSTLVHYETPGCFDPIPILPTDPPKTIAERGNPNDPNGYFHVSNVYEGFGMDKVAKGSVKYLRVVESPEKRFWTQTLWEGSGTQAPGMAWDDFNNKRIIGTVPVEEDGSVSFAVPAEKYVYFQLLDENQMLIQSMRSGIMARPGETNACVGCHESRIDAPTSGSLAGAAESSEPKALEPWFGAPRLFSYREEVQPVFDKYCVACHDFGKKAGEKLILAGDRNPAFNASYWSIRSGGFVRVPGAGPHNVLPPYTWGSTQSALAKIFIDGHENPEIDAKRKELGLFVDKTTDPEAFLRVVTWIDINAPYYPTYGSAYRDNPHGRSPLTSDETKRLETLTGLQGRDLEKSVLFDRPERSPCLNKWGAADALVSPDYKEALGIIALGKERLEKQGRGEEEDFQPVADVEVEQEKRYERFQAQAKAFRDAKLKGEKLSDLDFLN
ncbi:MAG: hypothetical protein IJM30_08480 [Thermoguttaceae bacterium]|nr:hypothetical protein [Thermoguttaceae bacterium]